MSVNYLRFIPTDPVYDPPLAKDQQAEQLLASCVPKSTEITSHRYETIQFVDAGSNWELIHCPGCRAILEEDVWGSLVDQASVTHFANLSLSMPCCGAISSLNDLHYGWPVGFARFVLQARDPNAELNGEQLRLLEEVLGCHLRTIWAHY
jgi:hypothetical protein